jgi:hypothetical protein
MAAAEDQHLLWGSVGSAQGDQESPARCGSVVVLVPAGDAAPSEPGVRRVLPSGEGWRDARLPRGSSQRIGSTVSNGPRTATAAVGGPTPAGSTCKGSDRWRSPSTARSKVGSRPSRFAAKDAAGCWSYPATRCPPDPWNPAEPRSVSMSASSASQPPPTASICPTLALGRWSEARLSTAQRALARKQRGSSNYGRARATLAARHHKLANQRRNFHHQAARALVTRYSLLVVEDLRIHNMVRRPAPRHDPDQRGRFLPNRAASTTRAGLGSCRSCAPKRKRLDVW